MKGTDGPWAGNFASALCGSPGIYAHTEAGGWLARLLAPRRAAHLAFPTTWFGPRPLGQRSPKGGADQPKFWALGFGGLSGICFGCEASSRQKRRPSGARNEAAGGSLPLLPGGCPPLHPLPVRAPLADRPPQTRSESTAFAKAIVQHTTSPAGEENWWANNGGAQWKGNRAPTASVNFVCAHDGFTLADLVAYNEKHNEVCFVCGGGCGAPMSFRGGLGRLGRLLGRRSVGVYWDAFGGVL